MSHPQLSLTRLDSRQGDFRRGLAELRAPAQPAGNVVSEAGRQRTIEVFGEPLSPAQVVERICRDVRTAGPGGGARLLGRMDKAPLTAATSRAGRANWPPPIGPPIRSFWPPSAASATASWNFQTAILHRDVPARRPGGSLLAALCAARRVGICVPGGAAAYPSTVLMTAVPAQAAGVANWPWWPRRRSSAPTIAICWPPATNWASARSIAWAGPRPWRRWPTASRAAAGRQDRRPRQPVRGAGQEVRLSARSTSIRSPGRARWWSLPTIRPGPISWPPT